MRSTARLLATASAFVGLWSASAAAAPDVVASIKPIHSLVASIMAGVGEPKLIVDGVGSPHTYAMKPSNAADLEAADVVFWAGDGLEAFLVKPLQTLGAKAKVVELIETPGLLKLSYREGGAFEEDRHEDEGAPHDAAHQDHDHHDSAAAAASSADGHGEKGHSHEADHAGHAHGGYDMHFWLDPRNAKAMSHQIAATLAAADPENAKTYEANAAKLDGKLDALEAETEAALAPVKGKPFIVFHDAYQYFEKRFGVVAAGSITVSPETIPGVQRVSEIQKKVRELGATCVFAEPQFEPKLVSVVTDGTSARTGILDPEGAELSNGPDLYFQLIGALATSLKDCLAQQS